MKEIVEYPFLAIRSKEFYRERVMEIVENVKELVDNVVDAAEDVAGYAYLFRKQLGISPAAGADLGDMAARKLLPETGPRPTSEEWDKGVRAEFGKKGARQPALEPDSGPRLTPDEWDKSVKENLANKSRATEIEAAPKVTSAPESVVSPSASPSAPPKVDVGPLEPSASVANPVKAPAAVLEPGGAASSAVVGAEKSVTAVSEVIPTKAPSELETATPKPLPSNAGEVKEPHPLASEPKAASATVDSVATKVPPAAEATAVKAPKAAEYMGRVEPELVHAPNSHASTAKAATASHTPDVHVVKSTAVAPDAVHAQALHAAKAPHGPHPGVSAAAHRTEAAAAELVAKESASLAVKSALRVAVGPEVAIGLAVVSALPTAYNFVDEASGHAISKSALGKNVAWLNEQSGANHAAHQVSGWIDFGLDALSRAAVKTGADKALIAATENVSRISEETGLTAGLHKVGKLWDAGAAKLEKAIHENWHGPDNPAHKSAPGAGHSEAPGHSTAALDTKPASPATAGAHAPTPGDKHVVAQPSSATPSESQAAVHNPTATSHPHGIASAQKQHAQESKGPGYNGGAASPHPAVPKMSASAHHAAPSETNAPLPVSDALSTPANGTEGLSRALAGHMDTHGMVADSKALADPMARALANFLADSPNSSTYLVINPKSEGVATMTGRGSDVPAPGDLPRIQSDTLEGVAKSGISPEGVSAVREALPSETKAKSDLELADALGVAAVARIGEKGLDVAAVDRLQDHIVKSSDGAEYAVAPDRLSTVKVLHDMSESPARDFAVIESSATGNRLIGAMSESEFSGHVAKPDSDLVALDVSGLRNELNLPESGPPAPAESSQTLGSIKSFAEVPAIPEASARQASQSKPDMADAGPSMGL